MENILEPRPTAGRPTFTLPRENNARSLQDHFSNHRLHHRSFQTPHTSIQKRKGTNARKDITLELNPFLIQNVNSRNTKILSNKTTTRLTRVQQHRVFISGLVPRNRPRLIGWAFYFYKCSPIVLGKNRGGCSWFVHIPPIENIFLVVSKSPF